MFPRLLRPLCLSPVALLALPSLAAEPDGDLVVSSPGVVVNTYAPLAVDVDEGADRFTLSDISLLDATVPGIFATDEIGPGSVLALYQPQGAVIDLSDTPDFGEVLDLNGAGSFELVVVESIEGDTVILDLFEKPGGLVNSYKVSGRTQVIRVPMFSSLTVELGANIVAAPWNGTTGGAVVLSVSGTLVLEGTIDANLRGFRGAPRVNNPSGYGYLGYRTGASDLGARKGEGIYGSWSDLVESSAHLGRGAPANGGGGGNAHNAAGGGGANGHVGHEWNGQGVMNDALGWSLDPAYIELGGLTDSSGGGRGGYTFGNQNRDALTVPPRRQPLGRRLAAADRGLRWPARRQRPPLPALHGRRRRRGLREQRRRWQRRARWRPRLCDRRGGNRGRRAPAGQWWPR